MKLSESEQREIEKEARKFAFTILGIEVNDILADNSLIAGYIAGTTAMAEKKNLEVKVWKNTADEFKKYNDGLKAQLELEKLKEWREINMQEVANTVLGNEIFQQQLKAKEAELSRVKEVAEKMAEVLTEVLLQPQTPGKVIQQALTEFANLMNKEK